MERRGKFIVLEGIDGSGTTTQGPLLKKYLESLGREALFTFEPTAYETGKRIKEKLKTDQDPRKDGLLYAQLFVEDRKYHLQKDILPALAQGKEVVCDRYKYSTLAYQWAQGIDLNRLIEMHQGCLIPDLIFLFDLPAEAALERILKDTARKTAEVFEKKDFLALLRNKYLELKRSSYLPKEERSRIFVIDASRPIKEVYQTIVAQVEKLLNT